MRKRSAVNALIAQLQRHKRFMATCPSCFEEFHLRDAMLFSVSDPPPEIALAAIQRIRDDIQEQKAELAQAKLRMTKRAQNTAKAVNLGKIIEKIVPSFLGFPYSDGDCRALFEPIDYLIFSGLASRRQVDALYFVDVKSGRARLTRKQASIKNAVEAGAVKFKLTAP